MTPEQVRQIENVMIKRNIVKREVDEAVAASREASNACTEARRKSDAVCEEYYKVLHDITADQGAEV